MATAGNIRTEGTRATGRRGGEVVVELTQAARRRAIGAARRHTWLVRGLKMLLPLGTLAAFSVYVIYLAPSLFAPPGLKPGPVEFTADDLKMKNPSYFGTSKDGSKYEVRAAEAAVDFAQTGPIRLTTIEGDLLQLSGVTTKLQAVRGNFDQKANELELYDGVNIATSTGVKAFLKRAMVYTKENRVVSSDPVRALMPTGSIQANSMDLRTKEKKATFVGAVAVNLVQAPEGQPRANLGIGRDTRAPVDVKAEKLAIDDAIRHADFTGSVVATQGQSVLEAATLHLEYEGRAEVPGAPEIKPTIEVGAEPQAARLTKMQARTSVVLTQGADRRASADAADFDIATDRALMTGNVEVTQGRQKMRGCRLAVDRRAGKLHLDCPPEAKQPAGRIYATFYQAQALAAAPSKAGAKPAPVQPAPSEGDGGLMQFKTDPNAPIDIEADTLEVNDTAKVAIFKGKVKAQQGEFIIQTAELHAIYSGQTGLVAPASAADEAAQRAGAQIARIETKNGVLITSKDGRQASGNAAVFDVKANTMVMTGAGAEGVKISDGRQIIVTSKLRMDMTTGEARFINDPGASGTIPAIAVPGGTEAAPQAGACKPGQQCLLFYPKDQQEKQKQQQKAPAAEKPKQPAVTDGWSSQTAPSPPKRAP